MVGCRADLVQLWPEQIGARGVRHDRPRRVTVPIYSGNLTTNWSREAGPARRTRRSAKRLERWPGNPALFPALTNY